MHFSVEESSVAGSCNPCQTGLHCWVGHPLGNNSLAKQYPRIQESSDWAACRTLKCLLFTAYQGYSFLRISTFLFSWGSGSRFFQHTRPSSMSSIASICIIIRSLTESLMCSRRRPPVSLICDWTFGATPKSLDSEPVSQRTPPVTASLLRLHKALLLLPWKARPAALCNLCNLAAVCGTGSLTLLHWVLLCTPTNIPVQTWFSKGKMGMKASSPFPL